MPPTQSTPDSLKPWQFFTLGGLVCATVGVLLIRGTSAGNVIFVCLGIFGAALVGLAVLNTLRPLVTGETREPDMVGSRTRASLEREKNLVLRSIKELDFDHAMGKVGEADYEEMAGRLRARAVRLLQQLDSAGSGYRDLIERELAVRLVKAGSMPPVKSDAALMESEKEAASPEPDDSAGCASCGTANDADARFCKSCGTKLLALVAALLGPSALFLLPFTFFFFLFSLAAPAHAQFQMPDPKEMSGIPRPVTDLPAGHVSVRLIRGQLSNNIQGHPVEIRAGSKVLTEKTDENGRAEFSGVAAGTTVRAVATVDGEQLESQEFPWPGEGGIRLMLVATAKAGAASAPAAPAQPGNVVLGDQTRIIIDQTDDSLQVYYILDILNSAREPVIPATGVVFDLPTGAVSATVLNGGPQAVARGDRITVAGPFQPGRTSVEVAYGLPFSSGDVSIKQVMPVPVSGVAVLIKKTGELGLQSPQLPTLQEREFEGERYILGQGTALAAGGTLALSISGLPHHTPVPRRVALALVALVLGMAIWASMSRPTRGPDAARVKQLTSRREKIFNDLVRLEQLRRTDGVDQARYADRRPALMAQLERVYRDLDAEGGRGAAA